MILNEAYKNDVLQMATENGIVMDDTQLNQAWINVQKAVEEYNYGYDDAIRNALEDATGIKLPVLADRDISDKEIIEEILTKIGTSRIFCESGALRKLFWCDIPDSGFWIKLANGKKVIFNIDHL